jgi:hypothetical protein
VRVGETRSRCGLNVDNESFPSMVGKLFGHQDIQLGDRLSRALPSAFRAPFAETSRRMCTIGRLTCVIFDFSEARSWSSIRCRDVCGMDTQTIVTFGEEGSKQAVDWQPRKEAHEKLGNAQVALAETAKHDQSLDVRRDALARITDIERLNDILRWMEHVAGFQKRRTCTDTAELRDAVHESIERAIDGILSQSILTEVAAPGLRRRAPARAGRRRLAEAPGAWGRAGAEVRLRGGDGSDSRGCRRT